jgi:pimeloyl-ACP methyl ester carboxylesterase
VATTAAGGWYYADELLLVDTLPTEYPIEVIEVSETSIILTGEGADQPGLTGLDWEGGYARLGPDIERNGDTITRALTPFPDLPERGTMARANFYAYPLELASFRKVSELDAEEVTYNGPLGAYPATYLPGESKRWVIHVHGRGATRAEGFRLIPAIHQQGYPQLAISFRNDEGAPPDPDGEYGLGWTESEDLAAAIEYARSHGAEDVVLVGYSMGGSVIGNYLRVHGSQGVAGVVYDSPALSWGDILAYESGNRNLPAFAGTIASTVVRMRTGINLGVMDQVKHADRLDVPVLLFHGSADPTVPVASSDAFAEARPDLVTYIRLDGVGHVQSWNADPTAYETTTIGFLNALA